VRAEVVHDDLGPVLRHEKGLFLPDPTAGAGDYSDLTFEQHCASLLGFDAVGVKLVVCPTPSRLVKARRSDFAAFRPPQAWARKAAPMTEGRGHVLLVDDNADLREALKELRALEGFEVTAVGSGEECLDMLDGGCA